LKALIDFTSPNLPFRGGKKSPSGSDASELGVNSLGGTYILIVLKTAIGPFVQPHFAHIKLKGVQKPIYNISLLNDQLSDRKFASLQIMRMKKNFMLMILKMMLMILRNRAYDFGKASQRLE